MFLTPVNREVTHDLALTVALGVGLAVMAVSKVPEAKSGEMFRPSLKALTIMSRVMLRPLWGRNP